MDEIKLILEKLYENLMNDDIHECLEIYYELLDKIENCIDFIRKDNESDSEFRERILNSKKEINE